MVAASTLPDEILNGSLETDGGSNNRKITQCQTR